MRGGKCSMSVVTFRNVKVAGVCSLFNGMVALVIHGKECTSFSISIVPGFTTTLSRNINLVGYLK